MGIRTLDFNDGFSQSTAPSSAGGANTVATETISAGGTITVPTGSQTIVRVDGNAGAVTASSTPFGTTPPEDGTIIILMGKDATNTVTITHNDAADGCILNGNATLGLNDVVKLVYMETEDRYIELSRNF